MIAEEIFKKVQEMLKKAQEKANKEKLRQYILIEPLYEHIIITRFKGQGDKVLMEIYPNE